MDLHDFGRVMALEEDGLMAFFQDHGLLRRQLHCTTCTRRSSGRRQLRCPLRLTLSFVPHQEEANNGHNVRRGASSHAEVAGTNLLVVLQHLRWHRNNHVRSVFGHCGTVVSVLPVCNTTLHNVFKDYTTFAFSCFSSVTVCIDVVKD